MSWQLETSMELNLYSWVILLFMLGFKILDTWGEALNVKRLDGTIPGDFQDTVDAEDYSKLVNYTHANTRLDWVSRWLGLMLVLLFWFLGGFGVVYEWVAGFGWHEVWAGCLFFAVLYLLQMMVDLPFDWFHTFKVEEKFGFNRTDTKTFVLDRIKGLGLALVLGVPLLAMVLWFFSSAGELGWLWGWMAFSAVSFALAYVAPTWLLPLFNKFEPMEQGSLRQSIEDLAQEQEFPLTDISVMDGSKRSTKSNAFFTGFGKRKRIALFDNLMERHEDSEILGVLAHEIGHYRLGHIKKMMVISVLQTGVMFFLAGWFMQSEGLHAAFGISEVHVYTGLVFFSLLFTPLSRLLSLGVLALSRKHEFEADAFAAKATGETEPMVDALKKLTKDNLGMLSPHPLYVWLNDSHPPMVERIEALKNIAR
ncbi:MAG: M48 family metallopeptidase [Verrucomicrobiota bacterium]